MKSKKTDIAKLQRELEQRFSQPQVVKDDDGNVITTFVYSGMTSTYRMQIDSVLFSLAKQKDRFMFDAMLECEFLNPDFDAWREKHGISLHDIEDELLNASFENAQVLNEIKVKWLKEWFAAHTRPQRAKKTIKDLMKIVDEQKQKLLDVMHTLIDGEKGKRVALVCLVCVELGLLNEKPKYQILKAEFGNIGNPSGYNAQYSRTLDHHDKQEIHGIKRHLLPFKKLLK